MYIRTFLIFSLLIQMLLPLTAQENSSKYDLQKVTIQLSWFDQFQFAGYYMAKEKGFYRQLGLDVEIIPFKFGVDIPHEVNVGNIDFSIGRETLILEKAKNKNIVALFALFQSSPLVLLSTQESGINNIKDFSNKTIMATIDDASEVSLKSMIRSRNIDFKSLNFIKHTHNIKDLINKKTDIISAYLSKAPYTLQKENIKYNSFNPKDYGFDMYSDLLYTSNLLISKNSQMVLKFKEASLQGWKYAYDNIEESVNHILKKYNSQNLSKEELLFEAKTLKKLSYTKANKLGDIQLNKIQRIYDLYNLMGLVPNKISLNDFVFNETRFYSKLTQEEKQFIKDHPIITLGEQEALKPINFFNSIGIHDGLLHDYMTIISEKTGLRFVSEIDTKENLVNKLKNNKIDLVAISLNQKTTGLLHTQKYFQLHNRAFQLRDSNRGEIHKIGIFNFFYNKDEFFTIAKAYPNVEIVTSYFIEDAVQNLLDRKIDLLYISEELLLTYIQDQQINTIEYAQSKLNPIDVPLSFAMTKDKKLLQSILNKSIKSIPYSQNESIRKKWIPVMIDTRFDWKQIWQLLTILAVVFVMIIYKQISMHKVNTELQKANLKLKELSELDSLTKLYNRRYFENYVEDILGIGLTDKNSSSLVMFDIDDFKKINDTYGHHIGDKVLIDLAKNLKTFNRKSDVIARIGGEEFLILLQNTSIEGATQHCERLRQMIEDLEIKDEDTNQTVKFTVSMGLTKINNDDTLDSILLRVDDSLYKVKRTGKNSLLVS